LSITAPTNVVVLVPLVSSAGSAWLLNAFVCACGVRQFKQVLHIDEGFQVGILYLCRTPKLLKLLRRLRQVSLVRAAPGLISVEHLDTTVYEALLQDLVATICMPELIWSPASLLITLRRLLHHRVWHADRTIDVFDLLSDFAILLVRREVDQVATSSHKIVDGREVECLARVRLV